MNTRTFWLAGALAACGPAALAADPAAAPVTPAGAPAAQTYTLRYKFKPGDVNYYKMTMDSNGTLGGPGGQSLPIKQHMVFFYHQAVTAVSAKDGSATLTTKFDSADLSITMNGQAMPGSDSLAGQLKSRTLTTTVSPNGKTTAPADAATGAAMPGMDFSKLANFQGGALLPDGSLKIGDTWKGPTELNGTLGPQMAGIQATAQSTLASVDTAAGKTAATINQITTGQAIPSDAPMMGMSMTVSGKVNGTGVLKFDPDAGVVLSQTATTTLNMTLTPKGDAGAAGGAGPIPVQFTITTDLEKVDPAAVPKSAAATAPTAAPAVAQ